MARRAEFLAIRAVVRDLIGVIGSLALIHLSMGCGAHHKSDAPNWDVAATPVQDAGADSEATPARSTIDSARDIGADTTSSITTKPDYGPDTEDVTTPDRVESHFDAVDGSPDPVALPDCPRDATWEDPIQVTGLPTSKDQRLLSITPDELSIVYLISSTLYTSSRDTPSDPFAKRTRVSLPNSFVATDGVALTPNGLDLVVVSADHRRFGELHRSARDKAFGTAVDETVYAGINSWVTNTGRRLSAPVVAMDGTALYFNAYQPSSYSSVFEAARGSSVYRAPVAIAEGILDGDAGERRLPTSMSADLRTFFYFNEQTAEPEARWSNGSHYAFYDVITLTRRVDVRANANCSRLYSTQGGVIVYEAR